ncbi:MAG: protein translocase subunit SecF [Armatimonadota bacterium]|nr:protein translocase subunit SecF [Armatimonadota bacterium]MDW8156200.1 protein translocase subunit SecF [Armatimonadota bacterium]
MRAWNLMGNRRWLYLASALVVVASLAAMAVQPALGRPVLNWGVDFTGGTLITFRFQDRSVSTGQVRAGLQPLGLGEAVIQKVQETGDISVRTRHLEPEERRRVEQVLRERVGSFTVLSVDDVGPKIGRELRNIAILGVALGLALQVVYVSLRFRSVRFAVAADLALLHDLLLVLGVFALTRATVDSSFVAVLLTVVGYSINDTIVVFDRVRENLQLRGREPFADLVNRSVLEALVRSLNTALTTLLAIGSVYLFGGPTVRDFALGLTVAVLTGGWSSIGVASPILVDLTEWAERRAGQVAVQPAARPARAAATGRRRS